MNSILPSQLREMILPEPVEISLDGRDFAQQYGRELMNEYTPDLASIDEPEPAEIQVDIAAEEILLAHPIDGQVPETLERQGVEQLPKMEVESTRLSEVDETHNFSVVPHNVSPIQHIDKTMLVDQSEPKHSSHQAESLPSQKQPEPIQTPAGAVQNIPIVEAEEYQQPVAKLYPIQSEILLTKIPKNMDERERQIPTAKAIGFVALPAANTNRSRPVSRVLTEDLSKSPVETDSEIRSMKKPPTVDHLVQLNPQTGRIDQQAAAVSLSPARPVFSQQPAILDMNDTTHWMSKLSGDIASLSTAQGRINFQLKPSYLGKLTVDISNIGGSEVIRLETENESAKALILSAQSRLEQDIRHSGMKTARIDVSVQKEAAEQSFLDSADSREFDRRPAREPIVRSNSQITDNHQTITNREAILPDQSTRYA